MFSRICNSLPRSRLDKGHSPAHNLSLRSPHPHPPPTLSFATLAIPQLAKHSPFSQLRVPSSRTPLSPHHQPQKLPSSPQQNDKLTRDTGRGSCLRCLTPLPHYPLAHSPDESFPRLLQLHVRRHHLSRPCLPRFRMGTRPPKTIQRCHSDSTSRARTKQDKPRKTQGLGPAKPLPPCHSIMGCKYGHCVGAGGKEPIFKSSTEVSPSKSLRPGPHIGSIDRYCGV